MCVSDTWCSAATEHGMRAPLERCPQPPEKAVPKEKKSEMRFSCGQHSSNYLLISTSST